MLNRSSAFTCACVLLVLIVFSGCSGHNDPRSHITGDVTFAGQPVVFGAIEFMPDRSKGHSGPAGYADIIKGHYDTRMTASGVVFGPHVVKISVYDGPFPDVTDEQAVRGVPLPKAYCVWYPMEMDLNADEHDIEIPESARGYKPPTR